MNTIPHKDYYVYALRRPAKPDTPSHLINQDGTVIFYYGKGRGARIFQHEWCAARSEQCRHVSCRVIRKVWREDKQIKKEKIQEHLTEQEAHALEISLIAQGRKLGYPLVNLTDGGEGISGFKGDTHPPSQREKHGKRMKTRHVSDPQLAEHQRQVMLHYWDTHPAELEQYRLKMTDPIARAKAGAANIGNTYNAKSYNDGFVSPDGKIFTGIHNLKAFCEEHHLNSAQMGKVYRGEHLSHQGWTRYPALEHESKPAYGKSGFKSPDGIIHDAGTIPNLAEFCREHGLNRPCMVNLGNGKLHSHKGWTRYPEIKPRQDYHGTYTGPALLSPDGKVYTTEDVDNLTRFCRTHGLQTSCMCMVSQGKKSSHKGWTVYRPEIVQPSLF